MARLTWSPEAAQEIIALVEELEDHPRIGRVVPEYREESVRERIYHNYRVVYELTGNSIESWPSCTAPGASRTSPDGRISRTREEFLAPGFVEMFVEITTKTHIQRQNTTNRDLLKRL